MGFVVGVGVAGVVHRLDAAQALLHLRGYLGILRADHGGGELIPVQVDPGDPVAAGRLQLGLPVGGAVAAVGDQDAQVGVGPVLLQPVQHHVPGPAVGGGGMVLRGPQWDDAGGVLPVAPLAVLVVGVVDAQAEGDVVAVFRDVLIIALRLRVSEAVVEGSVRRE